MWAQRGLHEMARMRNANYSHSQLVKPASNSQHPKNEHLSALVEHGRGWALHVDNLSARYGNQVVLDQLSFRLEPGQIGCLLGPSGCGKTTALRCIAGFVRPDSGSIILDQEVLANTATWVEPEDRGVGLVFQDFALFPHLTVKENIGFGLQHMPKAQRARRVDQMLELADINVIAQRYAHELSGGQQQRVALARALAPSPRLILLDEPFSNLDPDLRERLALEVRQLLQLSHTTALLVTHDQHEAFAMADVIGVMQDGRLDQWADPYALYHRPASVAVADFVGRGVWIPGRLLEENNAYTIAIELGGLPLIDPSQIAAAKQAAAADGTLRVLLRPDDVIHDDESNIQAVVLRKAFRGAEFIYTLRLPSGSELLALVPSHHDHAIGEPIGIRFNADHVVTFPSTVAK